MPDTGLTTFVYLTHLILINNTMGWAERDHAHFTEWETEPEKQNTVFSKLFKAHRHSHLLSSYFVWGAS